MNATNLPEKYKEIHKQITAAKQSLDTLRTTPKRQDQVMQRLTKHEELENALLNIVTNLLNVQIQVSNDVYDEE